MNPLAWLFDASGFVPRKDCGEWSPGLIALHNLSDFGIWIAYLAIPFVLFYFVGRRRDLPFPRLFLLFGLFIVSCGFTHFMEVVLFYHPLYHLAGLVKLVTAVVSLGTVVALVPLVPRVLALRGPQELEREIAARQGAEAALQTANAELERRVQERTAELVRQREWFRTTLASIADAVIVTDVHGRVTFMNPVAEDLTGWDPAAAAGQPMDRVFRVIDGSRGGRSRGRTSTCWRPAVPSG